MVVLLFQVYVEEVISMTFVVDVVSLVGGLLSFWCTRFRGILSLL